jgi:hypothetical protein
MGVHAQSRATKAPSASCTPTPTFHASQGHPPVTRTAANEKGAVGLDTVLKPPVRGPPTSGLRGLCDGLIPHPRKKKHLLRKMKRKKTERITR